MPRSNIKIQKILIDILYISIIFTITSLIGRVIGLNISIAYQIFLVFSLSLLIKYFIIYPLFFLISLSLALFVMFFINKYRFPIFTYIRDIFLILIYNIIDNVQSLRPIVDYNISLLYIIILVFTALFTAIIVYKMKRIILLLPIYLFIFLIYWYSFIDDAYIFTVLFLFFFLILYGIDKYRKNEKASKTFHIWSATSLVYSVLIISIAFILPKSNDYISWPYLQQKIYNAFPAVEDLRYYKEYNRNTSNSKLFNFSTSGFSEKDKDLGGPLVLSERKVMTVESNETLYLRGNAKHIYTGRSWLDISYNIQEHKMKQDVSFLLDSEKDRYFTRENISIKFDSFSSKTIFTPYKPEIINSSRDFSIFVNEDDIITSTEGIYKNEGYSVNFLKPLPYEKLINNRINKWKDDLLDLNLYTEIPQEIITDRTRQLTSSIVEDQINDYQKAISIQNYLRDNYKYNLDVSILPEGEDFVDYFLFEEKEGYCTYFASAMAVMLRLEGIPTRYIEGYVVEEKIEDNKYQVRQKHAHTWVEAFIEPVGWISFEPTAAYEVLDIAEEKEEEIPDVEETPKEDQEVDKPLEGEDIVIDEEDANNNQTNNIDPAFLKTIFYVSIITIILLILIRILIRYLKYENKEKYLTSLSYKEKTVYLYNDIIDLLDILGLPILGGETHFDYADRIKDYILISNDYSFKDITIIFVLAKYSEEDPSYEDMLSLINYKKLLEEELKDKLGKIFYFYKKYINIYNNKKKEIP